MKQSIFTKLFTTIILLNIVTFTYAQTYPIVGTSVSTHYNNSSTISAPGVGNSFYGQDADNAGTTPSYTDNGNNTITDNITGLMWQKSPDHNGNNNGSITAVDKLTWAEIQAKVTALNAANYAGYNDWRIPTIKELYSLTNWNGTDPSGVTNNNTSGLVPFLDISYFDFAWGDVNNEERLIDVQYASSNLYGDIDCHGEQLLFGFNFADGRIKGYSLILMGVAKTFSLICVRGNPAYGINSFVDNGDNTISDNATQLMWSKDDNQMPVNWETALNLAQAKNADNWLGYDDWRLPNAKELHSILDYSRAPVANGSAAINPIFNISSITNEAGVTDWPWFWSSTTHVGTNGTVTSAKNAVYLAFGTAAGWDKPPFGSYYSYCDFHGAGAQRSDPKSGTWLGNYLGQDAEGNNVYGHGPQGDILRVNNHVRLVRDLSETTSIYENEIFNLNVYPNPAQNKIVVSSDEELETIIIFNILGEKILEQSAFQNKITINTSQLSNGIYFMSIFSHERKFSIREIIIDK